ncbi:MAG: T9SS type A sorting domain-containing protein [Bacteroidales bacterium]
MPDNIIFEILAANPDELREPDLLQYLEEKADPLPQYMIDILREVAAGTTYKTVLQQQMAQYSHAKSRAANTMIRSLLNDTIMDYGLLRNWLDNLGGIRADEQIIETYLAEGNTAGALTLAGLIPQMYVLNGMAADRYGDYLDVLNLRIALMQAGKTRSELNQAEIALLETIANNNPSTAGAQARGWLEACYGYHFCDCMNIADDQGLKSTTVKPGEIATAYGMELLVEPNPAKTWTAFNYTLPAGSQTGRLTVRDVSGKLLHSATVSGHQGQYIWDTRKVEPGVYFYTFDANGKQKTGKLVIVK